MGPNGKGVSDALGGAGESSFGGVDSTLAVLADESREIDSDAPQPLRNTAPIESTTAITGLMTRPPQSQQSQQDHPLSKRRGPHDGHQIFGGSGVFPT